MADITIDAAAVESIGSNLINISDKFKSTKDNFFSTIENVPTWWQDQAGIDFKNSVLNYKETIDAIYFEMYSYGKFLQESAKVYIESQQANIDSIKNETGNSNITKGQIDARLEEFASGHANDINRILSAFTAKTGNPTIQIATTPVNESKSLNSSVVVTDSTKLYQSSMGGENIAGSMDQSKMNDLRVNSIHLQTADGQNISIRPDDAKYANMSTHDIIEQFKSEGQDIKSYSYGYSNGEVGDYTKTICYSEQFDVSGTSGQGDLSTTPINIPSSQNIYENFFDGASTTYTASSGNSISVSRAAGNEICVIDMSNPSSPVIKMGSFDNFEQGDSSSIVKYIGSDGVTYVIEKETLKIVPDAKG